MEIFGSSIGEKWMKKEVIKFYESQIVPEGMKTTPHARDSLQKLCRQNALTVEPKCLIQMGSRGPDGIEQHLF